jgi:hypothetical protein
LALSITTLGIMTLGILASGWFDATLAAGASFGVEQSLLYPPEVRARPVVVVNGGGFARRYWDPRYALLCSRPPKRHRWAEPVNP